MSDHSPFWDKRRHEDRRGVLRTRAAILRNVRAWFDGQGFVEADVGAIAPSPGAEVHVGAFAAGDAYLHTSPEFAMKKLIAAGEEKIYFLGKCYRAGETGPLHAPEFTMLEWYRAGAPYEEVMDDCVAIARVAAQTAQAASFAWRFRDCDPFAEPEKITIADAFARAELEVPTRSDEFAARLVTSIEPELGSPALSLVYEYPIGEAALARACAHDPNVAERFELYACGVELANGFGELTDAAEQRARLEAAMAEKYKRYGVRWPVDDDFIAALAQMPPTSGCALGIDRLVLLATGARSLDDVIWVPGS